MVSEFCFIFYCDELRAVLILVLMEDGLREYWKSICEDFAKKVLILVLMEDGLRDIEEDTEEPYDVLILVLMEDGLRDGYIT